MANDRTSSPCDDAFIKRNIKEWAAQNPRPTNEEIRNKLIAQGCTAEMVANYVTVASTVTTDGLFSQSKTQKSSREAQYYSDLLNKSIANKGGVYVHSDDGEFSVILRHFKPVPLTRRCVSFSPQTPLLKASTCRTIAPS